MLVHRRSHSARDRRCPGFSIFSKLHRVQITRVTTRSAVAPRHCPTPTTRACPPPRLPHTQPAARYPYLQPHLRTPAPRGARARLAHLTSPPRADCPRPSPRRHQLRSLASRRRRRQRRLWRHPQLQRRRRPPRLHHPPRHRPLTISIHLAGNCLIRHSERADGQRPPRVPI